MKQKKKNTRRDKYFDTVSLASNMCEQYDLDVLEQSLMDTEVYNIGKVGKMELLHALSTKDGSFDGSYCSRAEAATVKYNLKFNDAQYKHLVAAGNDATKEMHVDMENTQIGETAKLVVAPINEEQQYGNLPVWEEYRIADIFRQHGPISQSVADFPGSIMNEYLTRYTGNASGWHEDIDVRMKVLDGVLNERCRRDDPRSFSGAGPGAGCLVTIRTGDVLCANIRAGGNVYRLPASPAALAREVSGAQCSLTLFATGKHHAKNGGCINETAAYLADLGKHMGGNRIPLWSQKMPLHATRMMTCV